MSKFQACRTFVSDEVSDDVSGSSSELVWAVTYFHCSELVCASLISESGGTSPV